MRFFIFASVALLFALHLGSPAMAGVDLAQTDACLLEKMDRGQDPRQCLEAAHQPCHAEPPETHAVATVCYIAARKVWDGGVAVLMDRIVAQAPEEIATVAGIEVKYDLLSGLLQCDRLAELSQAVGNQSGDEIQRQKARCEAMASGLTYMRLKWRSRDVQ